MGLFLLSVLAQEFFACPTRYSPKNGSNHFYSEEEKHPVENIPHKKRGLKNILPLP